ncbi:MAG: polysaccharide deacetylase family protein [Myxococcales bacterium]|nr:polysaccharide deacetylase family protein [Myxococcales bacterium]
MKQVSWPRRPGPGARLVLAAALAAWAGCDAALSEYDSIYSRGADKYVLCGHSIDDKNFVSLDEIERAMVRARIDGTTLHLYAHKPTRTVERSTIESVLAAAERQGVPLVTYAELERGERPGTLALSFDDHDLVGWTSLQPAFERTRSQVTFFVSAYLDLSAEERGQLRTLATLGHDIQFHSTWHQNAESYTAEHGVTAYVDNEILPALTAMRTDGFAPTVFAYPFGARTSTVDDAMIPHFQHLRAIYATCPQ